MIKQVRTKNNTYSTVQYDADGNILTPARRRELRKLNKNKPKQNGKWIRIFSQFQGVCFICTEKIYPGTEILWNKKNKKTKHVVCQGS